MNPKISIAALIYRSAAYARWCYEGLRLATPELETGTAEFYFVANDAEPQLLEELQRERIPHYVNTNPRRTEEELFALGYGTPEYLHRVYRGWNAAIRHARGEWVALVNSDHIFAPGWLGAMLACAEERPRVVCAQQIERPHAKRGGVFPGAIPEDYGMLGSFRREAFLKHAARLASAARQGARTCPGGAYMPCLFAKSDAVAAGLYPEGNLAGASFGLVSQYGDACFFEKLAELGVEHVTALEAVAYHVQEGEMLE